MITFQIAARVRPDRQLVLTLPPEVPTGNVEIAIAIAVAAGAEQASPSYAPGSVRAAETVGAETVGVETVVVEQPRTQMEDARREVSRAEFRPAAGAGGGPEDGLGDEDSAVVLVDVPRGNSPRGSQAVPTATQSANGASAAPVPAATAAAGRSVVAEPDEAEPGEAESGEAEPDDAAPDVAEPIRPVPAAPTRSLATPAAPLQIGTVVGNYRLTRKLGQGHLGPVFAAQHTRQGRTAALKVLAREHATDPSCVDRFLEQGQILARLEHNNILRCHEVAEWQGHAFLVMELMDDGNLATILKRTGKLSIGNSIYVMLTCCQALQHAHELKVIHGNIKPENILIEKGEEVKLVDFGLLQVPSGANVDASTFAYLAPELAKRGPRDTDRRSDLYSLGILLYTMLTGSPPFSGANAGEITAAKEAGKFTPARKMSAEIPEKLDAIVTKLLAANPDERYQSCAALSLDLQALRLTNTRLGLARPTEAPPPPKVVSTPPAPRKLHRRELESVEGYWYAMLLADNGELVTRKVTYRQMLALVKNKSADATTQVSRNKDRDFQPLASYGEFHQLFTGQEVARARAAAPRTREPSDMSALLQEMTKEKMAQKRLSRRRWLQDVFAWQGGRGRWIVAGSAVVVGGCGLLFMSSHHRWWRLKRWLAGWFGHR